MNDQISHIDEKEKLKFKITLQFEEIKALRVDMLQARADLQRTFVYTFALATIVSTLVSRFSELQYPILLSALLLVTSIIFFMLSINYIGNMRHYLNIARYIEIKCKEIDEIINNETDSPYLSEILNWEIWNREFYKKTLSKSVFALTWGIQPVFPIFFGTLAILASLLINNYDLKTSWLILWSNWVLKALFIIATILLAGIILSLFTALIELNKDIKIAKNYFKYDKVKSKRIITPK